MRTIDGSSLPNAAHRAHDLKTVGARTRAATVHQVGTSVRLRVVEWVGERPIEGDGLETASGRRYLITAISKSGKGLTCTVLPPRHVPGTEIPGRWWSWWWARRR